MSRDIMAKTRSVRPSFWEDEKIVALPRDARLLFIGVWSAADDAGRLVWDASVVREQVFPHDGDLTDVMVARWMDLLTDAGLVRAYVVAGRTYGVVAGWARHQQVSRPKPSLFPAPVESVSASDGLVEDDMAGLTEVSSACGAAQVGLNVSDLSETMSESASQPLMPSLHPEGEVRGGVQKPETADDDNSKTDDQGNEVDEMGLYDDPVDDPFAPVVPRKPVPASVRPAAALKATGPAGGTGSGSGVAEDAQQPLIVVVQAPAVTPDAGVPASATEKAKRPTRKKAPENEQRAIFPPEVDALCEHLQKVARANIARFVSERRAKNVVISETGRDAADKLLRLDGFTYEQVLALVDWTAQDDFWRTNILSMTNLREKIDRLAMDQRFLGWARANGRPTKAAANGVPASSRPGGRNKVRAVDQQVHQDDLKEEW